MIDALGNSSTGILSFIVTMSIIGYFINTLHALISKYVQHALGNVHLTFRIGDPQ